MEASDGISFKTWLEAGDEQVTVDQNIRSLSWFSLQMQWTGPIINKKDQNQAMKDLAFEN